MPSGASGRVGRRAGMAGARAASATPGEGPRMALMLVALWRDRWLERDRCLRVMAGGFVVADEIRTAKRPAYGRRSVLLLRLLHLTSDQLGHPVGQRAAILLGQFLRLFLQVRLDAQIEDLGF